MATAAERHLEKILVAERQRGLVRLGLTRLLGGSSLLMAALVFGLAYDLPRWRALIPLIVGYLALSVPLYVIASRRPLSVRWLGYSPALFDVPFSGLLVLYPALSAGLPIDLVSTGCLMGAWIAISTASLSRSVVAVTHVSAMVTMAVIFNVAGRRFEEQVNVAIIVGGAMLIGIYLTERIRTLVAESRSADLLGKYILGERLGVGGMAEVFKATYSPEGGFERPVAVKRVLPHLVNDPQFIERFRREAELTARLVHPNIVQVLDFGRHLDTYFLAMEWVEGVPLNRLARSPLPACVVSWIALQLADALDFIHSRQGPDGRPLGLVHRDLNPPNILVSRLGEVKLADFGVARVTATPGVTRTGVVVGKLAYMAPEQLSGPQYDGRADLFALGATLHELLTGRRLFLASSDVETMQAVLNHPVPRLGAERSDVPRELEAIVMGLLERAVERRTLTGAMLRAQLMALTGEAAPLPKGQRMLAEVVVAAPPAAPVAAPKPPPQELPTATASIRPPT
jgi:hypothetical protein